MQTNGGIIVITTMGVALFLLGAGVFGLLGIVAKRLSSGKCKGCCALMPLTCLLWGLIGGALFVFCNAFFGCDEHRLLSPKGVIVFIFLSVLAVVAVVDWNTKLIYDRFHVVILLLSVPAMWFFPNISLWQRGLGCVIIAVPMLLLAVAFSGAFGGGDIKLMAASGFFLGAKSVVVACILALLSGGSYCAVLLLTKKVNRKEQLAFGPFLAFGLAIAAFYGEQIANWYLALTIQ